MAVITLSKKLIKEGDLVIISKREYEKLLKAFKILKNQEIILSLAKEARKLKKKGKLPVLRSLKYLL
jgi:hypothetical protein